MSLAMAVVPTVLPGHEDLLPEDRLSAQGTDTWRRDLIGYRAQAGGDRMIFACACGCGSHVAIPVSAYTPVGRARAGAHTKHGARAAFGRGFYVTGHAPLGIASPKARTGPAVRLKATS